MDPQTDLSDDDSVAPQLLSPPMSWLASLPENDLRIVPGAFPDEIQAPQNEVQPRWQVPRSRQELERAKRELSKAEMNSLGGLQTFVNDNTEILYGGARDLVTGAMSYWLLNKLFQGDTTQAVAGGIHSRVQDVLSGLIRAATEAIRTGHRPEIAVYKELHARIVAETKHEIDTLPPERADLQRAIRDLDDEIIEILSRQPSRGAMDPRLWKKLEIRQCVLYPPATSERVNLAHYREEDKPSAQNEPSLDQKITENKQALLKTLPKDQAEAADALIEAWRVASVAQDPSRVQFALIGPPGIGKSRLVNLVVKVFTDAGVDIDEIVVNYNYKATKHYASGNHPFRPKNPFFHASDPIEAAVEPAQLQILAGKRNCLVRFEEGVHLIKKEGFDEEALAAFDPANKTLPLTHLNVKIPFDSQAVVLTGNATADELHPAAASRFTVKSLGPLPREYRASALQEAMGKELKEMQTRRLTAEDKSEIETKAHELCDSILDEDMECNPGARRVQEVGRQVVQHLTGLKAGGQPFDDAELKSYIHRIFDADRTQAAASQARSASPNFDNFSAWPPATHAQRPSAANLANEPKQNAQEGPSGAAHTPPEAQPPSDLSPPQAPNKQAAEAPPATRHEPPSFGKRLRAAWKRR